jgi:hypothetical protein
MKDKAKKKNEDTKELQELFKKFLDSLVSKDEEHEQRQKKVLRDRFISQTRGKRVEISNSSQI